MARAKITDIDNYFQREKIFNLEHIFVWTLVWTNKTAEYYENPQFTR